MINCGFVYNLMIALSRWPAWIWAKIWTCWLFVRGTNLILQLRFSNSLIMYILCQNAHSTYHQGRPDKGGWSPERCWSRLSGKVNKPIWRESLKKVKKYKWLSTFIEHALPKRPGGGRGFPRWLRLVSPLIQSRCLLCYLRCWGRRGELVCLSTLETLSIILFQVHIWSVLTGASETILRGHTSPTAAAVIYAVYTVQFYYKC